MSAGTSSRGWSDITNIRSATPPDTNATCVLGNGYYETRYVCGYDFNFGLSYGTTLTAVDIRVSAGEEWPDGGLSLETAGWKVLFDYQESAVVTRRISIRTGGGFPRWATAVTSNQGLWGFNATTEATWQELDANGFRVCVNFEGARSCSPPPCRDFNVYVQWLQARVSYDVDPAWCPSAITCMNGAVTTCTMDAAYGSVCSYTCNYGYTRTGPTSITCLSTQAWSGSCGCSPLSNYCTPPTPAPHVILGTCGTTITSACAFSCEPGYAEVGSMFASCAADTQTTGTYLTPALDPWNPSCATIENYCPALASPSNGAVDVCARSVDTTCGYTCDNGYALDPDPLTLACVPLEVVEEEGVSASNYVFQTGFEGVWNATTPGGPTPTCARYAGYCTAPAAPANGSFVKCDTRIDGTCEFACDPGFALGIQASSTCTDAGASQGAFLDASDEAWVPLCTLIADYCPTISAPEHGSASVPARSIQTRTQPFACNRGYTLSHEPVLRCLEAAVLPSVPSNKITEAGFLGAWWAEGEPAGGVEVTCPLLAGYCPAYTPPNADVNACVRTLGGVCEHHCQHGYTAASGNTARVCQVGSGYEVGDGVWSGSALSCVLIDDYCPPLGAPSNGTVSPSPSPCPQTLGTVCATFGCNLGFDLAGPTTQTCLASTASSGAWSDPSPTTCTAFPEYCRLPADPEGELTGVGCRSVGSRCAFTCNEGFSSSNPTASRCSENTAGPNGGIWSPPFAPDNTLCTALPCAVDLVVPGNGTVNGGAGPVQGFTHDTASFACDPGFSLADAGMGSTRCLRNGTWSVPEAVCVPDPCAPLALPGNGTIVPLRPIGTTFETRRFVCNEGYLLEGPTSSQCQRDHTWTEAPPVCLPQPCLPPLPPLGNGTVSNPNGTTLQTSVYACNAGWTLVGTRVRTCETTLMWSTPEHPESCTANPCTPSLAPIPHGHPSTVDGGPHTVARYLCDPGYTLENPQLDNQTCLVTGNWTELRSVCIALPCAGVLAAPLNGHVSPTTGFTDDTTTYGCNAGFARLRGNVTRTCVPFNASVSQWDGSPLECQALPCPELVAPSHGTVSSTTGVTFDRVTYGCDAGYEITAGDASRECQTNSQWSGVAPRCTKIRDYCPPLVPPAHGYLFPDARGSCERRLDTNCTRRACNRGFFPTGPSWFVCGVGGARVGVWAPSTSSLWNCTVCPAGTYAVPAERGPSDGAWVAPPPPSPSSGDGDGDGDGGDPHERGEAPYGWRCTGCPLGGFCAGGSSVPVADDGWWQDPTTGAFLACVPPENCVNGHCRNGHTGERCRECKEGWFKKGGEHCRLCPPSKEIVYPFLIVLAILLCILLVFLAKRSTRYFASLAVGASFLQMISVLPSFKVRWPGMLNSFFESFEFMNLDISRVFEPKCLVSGGAGNSGGAFVTVWIIRMSLPLVFVATFALGGLLIVAYFHVRPLVPASLPLPLPTLDRREMMSLIWACVNAFLTCLLLSYLVVASAALGIYGCTRHQDGSLTMNAEPAISCRDPVWRNMVIVGTIELVLFCGGLPIVVALLLRYIRYDLWQEINVIRFGLLYQRYLRPVFWYELVMLARKLMFVFGKAVFPTLAVGQVAWALGVVVVGAGVHLVVQPFRDPLVNRLELFHLVCAAFVLVLGITFDATDDSMSDTTRNTLGIIVIIIIAINVLAIAAAVALAIRMQWKLVRHGVAGGYASDEITVSQLFFDHGMNITHKERRVSPLAVTWFLDISMETPLALEPELIQDQIGLGASAEEVLHDISQQPHYARIHVSEGGHRVRLWILLPCRGVYFARLTVPFHAISPDIQHAAAKLSGTLQERSTTHRALSANPLVVDFFIGTDRGCPENQRLVDPTPALVSRGGRINNPVVCVLERGASVAFSVACSGCAEMKVTQGPSVGQAGLTSPSQPLFIGTSEELGVMEGTVTIQLQSAAVLLWGRFDEQWEILAQYAVGDVGTGRFRSNSTLEADAMFKTLAPDSGGAEDDDALLWNTPVAADADADIELGTMV